MIWPAAIPLKHVVAFTKKDHAIGLEGKIPWHHPADLSHFKKVTQDHVLLMGRATYESLAKPLPGRFHFVLSQTRKIEKSTVHSVVSYADLLKKLETFSVDFPSWSERLKSGIAVCGGEKIYLETAPWAHEIFLTEIDEDHPGDRFYNVDLSPFSEVSCHSQGPLKFRHLIRK